MADRLNIAFAGTPELAARILENIHHSGQHSIAAVLTQPDKPSGRGKKMTMSPVKRIANQYAIPLFQPENKIDLEKETILNSVDVLIVAAYGLILTENALSLPQYGCINIHLSLLPRWRGAAPVQHAILAGDKKTGITIMQMDAGLDTGDILYQKVCSIEKDETSGSLQDKLCQLGCDSILTVLGGLTESAFKPVPQDNDFATYANKINKSDALIDWSKSAVEIDRLVRAMNPAPVAYSELGGQSVRVWEAEITDNIHGHHPPGTVVSYSPSGLEITTGENNITITKLQLPGKKVLSSSVFYNGNSTLWSGIDN